MFRISRAGFAASAYMDSTEAKAAVDTEVYADSKLDDEEKESFLKKV